MNQLAKVAPPRLDTLRVQVNPPATLIFSGTITSKDPSGDVGPFLRAVHEAALVDKIAELRVDVSALSFVNSSAIRLFVLDYYRNQPAGGRPRSSESDRAISDAQNG